MQVVILAGGLGTRLWPVTEHVPKPMVPVAGVPYLEHQLTLLHRQGLHDVLILTAYLGNQIEDYFGDGGKMGLRIRYSREPEPLGTGGALRNAMHLLEEVFVVIYGDSYLPIKYEEVGDRVTRSSALGALVVYRDLSGATGVPPNVALGGNDLVRRYDKAVGGDPELQWIEAGVLALRREAVGMISPGRKISLEQQLFPQLIERGLMLGLPTEQRFYDIGTMERLKVIGDLFA